MYTEVEPKKSEDIDQELWDCDSYKRLVVGVW